MITEDYVSFETAKLLKEKGFDEYCTKFYNNLNQNKIFELCNTQQLEGASVVSNKMLDDYLPTLQVKSIGYAVPTLQMAMKWLREVHNIHIILHPYPDMPGDNWSFILDKYAYGGWQELGIYITDSWNSYEEACEAAIKYCLEKLV